MVNIQVKRSKTAKLGRKRAVRPDLKDRRRLEILSAAEKLLARHQLDDIAMQDIADSAKIAKGTLYLYFQTKEELLLALLEREYRRWLNDLETWAVQKDSIAPAELIGWMVASLKDRPTLLKLLPRSESIIEVNVSVASITAYKRSLLVDMSSTAGVLSLRLGLTIDTVCQLFLYVHAAIVGVYFKAFPSVAVSEALQHDDLAPFRVDFYPALYVLIEGAYHALTSKDAGPSTDAEPPQLLRSLRPGIG